MSMPNVVMQFVIRYVRILTVVCLASATVASSPTYAQLLLLQTESFIDDATCGFGLPVEGLSKKMERYVTRR